MEDNIALENLNYINFSMKEINDSCDNIYESFFESDEELRDSILDLIVILNSILNDLKED